MAVVHRSVASKEDYREIWRYIAADDAAAADRLLGRIDFKLGLYAAHPRMGRSREDLAPGLRSFPVGNYVVFYQIVPDGIELVRVLHGARSHKRFFRK